LNEGDRGSYLGLAVGLLSIGLSSIDVSCSSLFKGGQGD